MFRSRISRTVVGAVVAASLGVAVARVTARDPERPSVGSPFDEERSVAEFDFTKVPDRALVAETAGREEVELAIDAPSPTAAVRTFLDAERDADHERSWDLLSESSRREAGRVAQWERSAAARPRIIGFELAATDVQGSQGTGPVVATIEYAAELSPTLGLVPPRVVAEFDTVAESNGFRVQYPPRLVSRTLAEVSGVVGAAEAWLAASRDCAGIDALVNPHEWSGGLIGDGAPDLVDALCEGVPARVRSAAQPLTDRFGIEPFVAAFGADIATWASTVELRGPRVHHDLVLAPIGERWLVVGVITVSPAHSG